MDVKISRAVGYRPIAVTSETPKPVSALGVEKEVGEKRDATRRRTVTLNVCERTTGLF